MESVLLVGLPSGGCAYMIFWPIQINFYINCGIGMLLRYEALVHVCVGYN
jgi:hypothetical protein